MLTYRTGAGGAPSAARFMADHLLEATIPSAQNARLQYYNGSSAPLGPNICSAELGDSIDPRPLAALGLSTTEKGLSREMIMNLLCGLRADGRPISGKQYQSGTTDIASTLDVSLASLSDPQTWQRLGGMAAGCAQDNMRRAAFKRLLHLYSVPQNHAVDEKLSLQLAAGLNFAGQKISRQTIGDAITSRRSPIGYIDLTWSADKSVSIAFALATTDAERAMILQAHQDAVTAVMAFIETIIGRARKGKAGAGGFEQGHIAWMQFIHFTARPTVDLEDTDLSSGETFTRPVSVMSPGDPQLHTHVVVPNAVVTRSGRVGALDLDRLGGRIKELGALYQAYLAQNLRKLGVKVAFDPKTGAARLPDVPDAVRDAFSKRTLGGRDAARHFATSQGLEWDNLTSSQRISLLKSGTQGDKRQPKSDDMADFVYWKQTAAGLGWTIPDFVGDHPITALTHPDQRLDHAHHLAGELVAERFKESAVLDEAVARHCAAQALIAFGVHAPEDIDIIIQTMHTRPLLLDGEETRLICVEHYNRRGDRSLKFTTGLHVTREQTVIELARNAANDRDGAITEPEIDEAILATGLDFSSSHGQAQRRAMTALATCGRLSVLVGVAGSGKTTLLAPLVQAWKKAGRTVWGTAIAWRQATDLADAGIPENQIKACHPLLHGIKTGKISLDANSVVILDELSLLSTIQLLELVQAQANSRCQLVLIGDPQQCQAVEAGPVVDLLRRALGPDTIPELVSSVRQTSERERATALMLRDGKSREALDRKREDGTLVLASGDYSDVVTRIADLWLERHHAGRTAPDFSLTVSAPTNADAREIAREIRIRRRQIGLLGEDLVQIDAIDQHGTTYPMTIARGDHVRLYARTNARYPTAGRGIIGNNGSVLEVLDADQTGLTLRNRTGREGFVAWTTLQHPQSSQIRLGYGDVLSIDATQGVTSTEHIEAMPRGSQAINAHRAYTQGSRHRERTWLVTSEAAERRQVAGRRALGDIRPIRSRDILDNMARNMARPDQREGALALLDKARAGRHSAHATLQQACLTIERTRQRTGSSPCLAHAVARHRHQKIHDLLVETVSSSLSAQTGHATSLSTGVTDLTAHLKKTISDALAPLADTLPAFRRRRARRLARKRAEERLRRQETRGWRRIERPLTDEEMPDWGTPDYFALIGLSGSNGRRSIGMTDAFDLYKHALWRKGDARRGKPVGLKTATREVTRLFQLTLPEAYSSNGPTDRYQDLVLTPHGQPSSLTDHLIDDLNDMEIAFRASARQPDSRVSISHHALVSALSAFDLETVLAVCDRFLLLARPDERQSPGISSDRTLTVTSERHHSGKSKASCHDRQRHSGYDL
ncbi:hypothetical protein BAR24_09390 [Gluconobacter oxydans]|uniref:MobF family relaxase n=1 Tax=Gluconobacter thailandicus TaxID=257438 RepID=UPI0002997DA5|nr:MobF family relaxase [Gluconobacter thailandicus]AFW02932.1 hypothetical protein B932_3387 [Gluconobacter oxydans H24]ANQ41654.1 hypothetical protein BAR24_09390 [Gluconobacter oxydans]